MATVIEHWVWVIVCPVIAYFIGAIPFSYIVAKRLTGDDLREIGNKNVGGLNVMIRSGFNWGIFAGWLDYSKGFVCIIAALAIPFNDEAIAGVGKYHEISIHDLIYILVAMAILLGHNYSIYIGFKGGRGMAAIVSFLVIANPILLLVFVVSIAIFMVLIKYVRPALFFAIFVGAPIAFFLNFFPPWIVIVGMDSTFTMGLFVLGIAIVILPKLLQSFIDMFKGKEYRVGKTGIVLAEENEKDTVKQ
ncbi:MAG: glycerol-3-phosphate acyltransferase [Candidatus Heimdallarchaeota archaeon]